MNVTVIDGQTLDKKAQRAWTDLQSQNLELRSPYFSPHFVRSVAAVVGNVEVAMIVSNGYPEAFFPFQRKNRHSAIPVAGALSDYQGIICRPGYVCDPRELLRKCQLSEWNFDHLLASQTSFAPYCKSQELSPLIDLSEGYDAYIKDRRNSGSELVKKCANLARRLNREFGPIRFVADSKSRGDLNQTLLWKSRQYIETSGWDLFATNWPRAIIEQIYATREESCAGILSTLHAGDKLVAGHFGMRSSTVWHYWFPSYDKELSKYSPGLILLLKMAEHANSLGLRTIDLGKGVSPYKARLMTGATELAEGAVTVASLGSIRRSLTSKVRGVIRRSPLADPARNVVRWIRKKHQMTGLKAT